MKPSLMGAVKLASFVATLASLSYVISWALRNAAGVGVVRWPSAGGGGANDIKETSRSPWSSDITILETLLRDSRPADRLQAVDGGTRRRLRLLTDRATGEELLGRINAYLKRGLTLVRPRPHSRNEKLGIYDIKKSEKYPSYVHFQNGIRRYRLYDPWAVTSLHHQMVNGRIIAVRETVGGTQLKLTLTLDDDSFVMWKPYRFDRAHESSKDIFYFSEFERFNSEIAAYHLDRILGFYRAPPTYGRDINITESFFPNARGSFVKTFFVSPAGNVCFHGNCPLYCVTGHSVCGRPEYIEGSVAAFLPSESLAKRTKMPHPWRRTRSKHKKEEWRTDTNYCDKVRGESIYAKGRRLLDIIDMAIFDFLIGNMDRNHYETFQVYGNDTFLLHFDNGKGFGRANIDEMSILAPLTQCCEVRRSTLDRLVELMSTSSSSPPLSQKMRLALEGDALRLLLTEAHLKALDRRVRKIVAAVLACSETKRRVVVDDHF